MKFIISFFCLFVSIAEAVEFKQVAECNLFAQSLSGERSREKLSKTGQNNQILMREQVDLVGNEYTFELRLFGFTAHHGNNRYSMFLFNSQGKLISSTNGNYSHGVPFTVGIHSNQAPHTFDNLNISCTVKAGLVR